MLHEFITENRERIIARCREHIAGRPAPRPTDAELEHGVPMFLDQLGDTLRRALAANPAIGETATHHGGELLYRGFTIAQVVHDYGGICQAITQLADELAAPIATHEFRVLNRCLDDAIAGAVTEYGRLREDAGTERLGIHAHELRNLLNTAFLAYEALKTTGVQGDGSTGRVLGRALAGLRSMVDGELADVRLRAGIRHRERIALRDFIEDIEVAASMEASTRGQQLAVANVADDVTVFADRQVLWSVVANLVHNAFKFTPPGGRIVLRASGAGEHVRIDVEDECGGLPPGKAEDLFRPFEQRSDDRSGVGLGLAICRRGMEANDGVLRVVDRPGIGCVFTAELPRWAERAERVPQDVAAARPPAQAEH